jgi:hypothetical protein
VNIDERKAAALAQESDRRPLGNVHLQSVRQRAANGGLRDPWNCFELPTTLFERNAQHALITINRKNFQHGSGFDVMIAGNVNLIGMNKSHLARREQKLAADIGAADARDAGRGPQRDAEIRLPGFPAKLAAPDFERFLPPKILRLFVSQDFLGISFRLDDS